MLFLSCFFCFHARLFIDALWSPAGKGLTFWLLFTMSNCHFPIRILCQAWCLIVSIPDLCPLSYFVTVELRLCEVPVHTHDNSLSCIHLYLHLYQMQQTDPVTLLKYIDK